MRQKGRLLKQVHVDPGSLAASPDDLGRVLEDMRAHGDFLTPQSNWIMLHGAAPQAGDGRDWIDEGFSAAAIEQRMSSMDKMLEPWLGTAQLGPAADSVERFRPWLADADPLGLWAANVEDPAVLAKLTAADLGTILDLSVIGPFLRPDRAPLRVLEVGGGYGRLAEAMVNVVAGVSLVLVDAVPASMLYAAEYLRRACPDARVGSYYDGDPFDLDRFDCYVVPAWHFERLNTYTYDLCVNIESFQEMTQRQVDWYLDLFDRLVEPRGVIYLSNHRDAVLKGDGQVLPALERWEFPDNWRVLLCSNSPRSGTPDHPVEVFRKEHGSWAAANAQIRAAHRWHAAQRRAVRPAPPPPPSQLPAWLAADAPAGRVLRRIVRARR